MTPNASNVVAFPLNNPRATPRAPDRVLHLGDIVVTGDRATLTRDGILYTGHVSSIIHHADGSSVVRVLCDDGLHRGFTVFAQPLDNPKGQSA